MYLEPIVISGISIGFCLATMMFALLPSVYIIPDPANNFGSVLGSTAGTGILIGGIAYGVLNYLSSNNKPFMSESSSSI